MKELRRSRVVEWAVVPEISERQSWRIEEWHRQAGGLVHGNGGQPSPRRLSSALRNEILAPAEGRYRYDNDRRLTEVQHEGCGL